MSKIEKTQTQTETQTQEPEVIMLTAKDIAVAGRGRTAVRSALYIAAAALPTPADDAYPAVRTDGKVSTVNNVIQSLKRDYPGRKYATRVRGTLIVRLA